MIAEASVKFSEIWMVCDQEQNNESLFQMIFFF